MNFSSPQKVSDTIRASDDVERVRAENRVKINDLFNGTPPLSVEEAKKMNLKVNTNWGEAAVLAHHARRQYSNAFLRPSNFFSVKIPSAPPENRQSWELIITQAINKPLKKSLSFFELYRNKFASIVAHGIGACVWYDNCSWLPKYVPIEDLRVPTDTPLSMENLPWFAVRHAYTAGELVRKVYGKNSDAGWNKPAIAKILHEYHGQNYENTEYTWMTAPEKMAELYKQNLGFYSSDAAPSITLWHFYFYDDEKSTDCAWKLVVVPEQGAVKGAPNDEFLYSSDKPVAKERSQILHIQFGDLNNKAPFLIHSIRSLGFLLMEPCFWTNLMRCRLVQHVFENFNLLLRSSESNGKARAQKVELFDRGWLDPSVSIVPQTERHQIQPQLVDMTMGQLRQLMSEASASYTQEIDSGTSREQTATETMAKVQQVNAMMSGMLATSFLYETFKYEEICRRFCLRKSLDPEVKRFQKLCEKAGIPPQYVNSELWDIEPVVPMGSGNPTMEQASAQQLLSMRPMFDPTAQQEILHEATAAITGDPRKADRWVPLDKRRGVTDAQRDAEFAFGVLMQGVPVRMKEGLSPIEQIDTLLGLTAGVIARLEAQTNLATPSELAGLASVGKYIGGLIQQLAQDKAQKARVKFYGDTLGKLMNSLKAFSQRLAAQQQSQGQGGGAAELQAKLQAMIIEAQSAAKIKEAKAAQQMKHKEMSFKLDQRRKNLQTLGDIQRRSILHEEETQPAATQTKQ